MRRKISNEQLQTLACMRQEIHRDHASSRPLSKDYELIGLLGEREFSERFDIPMDMTLRLGGDAGIDFHLGDLTIDVKTARIPKNLLVERGKIIADVYVLARALEWEAELLGWEWAMAMSLAEICCMPGFTIENHAIRRETLRPMSELIAAIKQGGTEVPPLSWQGRSTQSWIG